MPKLTLANLRKRVNPIDNKPDPDSTTHTNPIDKPKTLSLDKIAKLLDIKWKYFNEDANAKLAGMIAPTLDYMNNILDMMEPKCACNAVEVEDVDYMECTCNVRYDGCNHLKVAIKSAQYCGCEWGGGYHCHAGYKCNSVLREYPNCVENIGSRITKDVLVDDAICSSYYLRPLTTKTYGFCIKNSCGYHSNSLRTFDCYGQFSTTLQRGTGAKYKVDATTSYYRVKWTTDNNNPLSNPKMSRILSDNIIGLSWIYPEQGPDGWRYINSEGNMISDDEAERFIQSSPLFNPVDEVIGSNYMVKFSLGFVRTWTEKLHQCHALNKFCIVIGQSSPNKYYIRHPAFYNAYSGAEVNKFYLGKYKSGDFTTATSIPDVLPMTGKTYQTFCSYCKNIGTNYHCQTFYEHNYVSLLMLIASKGKIIDKFGFGSQEDTLVKTGSSGKFVMGLDDFYNNCYEWLIGVCAYGGSGKVGIYRLANPKVGWLNSSNGCYITTNYEDAMIDLNYSGYCITVNNNSYRSDIKTKWLPEVGFNLGLLMISEKDTTDKSKCSIPDLCKEDGGNTRWLASPILTGSSFKDTIDDTHGPFFYRMKTWGYGSSLTSADLSDVSGRIAYY